MHSGFRQRKHVRKEYSLVDFDAVFLALHQRAVGFDLFPRRCQPRNQFGDVVYELIHPIKSRQIFGKPEINRTGMLFQEIFADTSACEKDDVDRRLLLRCSQRFLGQFG